MAAEPESAEISIAEREDRLVWIFGSSRSGSTWLLQMLSALDEVAGIDDPHLGHHLGIWRPLPLAWAAASEPPELTTLQTIKRDKPSYFFSDRYRDAWAPALRNLIAARFDAEARDALGPRAASDRAAVVVKEPGSHAADLLLSLFPGSKLVFLLRDGRDVVDSWMAAYREGSWGVDEGMFAASREGRVPLIRWLASVWLYRTEVVESVFAQQDPERRLLVRYEDLREAPAQTLARICARFGLAADPGRLRRIAEQHSFERLPSGERGSDKPTRSAKPGAWRENLEKDEQEALMEILGPKVAALGYDVGSAPSRRFAAAR